MSRPVVSKDSLALNLEGRQARALRIPKDREPADAREIAERILPPRVELVLSGQAEAMEEAGPARAKAKIEGMKDEDQLKDLAIALGELPVINQDELREQCGMSYVTSWGMEEWLAREGAGPEVLASPHTAIALASIKAIIEDIMIPINQRARVKAWWDKNIIEKSEEEVAMELWKQSSGSSKKPNPKDYAKLAFSIKDEQGEKALVAAIKSMGVRKVDTAP